MLGATGDVAVVVSTGSVATVVPLQTLNPADVVDLPGTVRGPAAFVLVFLLGVALSWRFEPFLGRSIDASMDRPLAAVFYGAAALGVVVFAGSYLATQLAQLPVPGRYGGAVGLAVGLLLVVVASALGFAVVGSMVVELWSGRRSSGGLVLGALVAGVAASMDPVVGGLLWFVAVSAGIGGPVREWLHASEGPDLGDGRRD